MSQNLSSAAVVIGALRVKKAVFDVQCSTLVDNHGVFDCRLVGIVNTPDHMNIRRSVESAENMAHLCLNHRKYGFD